MDHCSEHTTMDSIGPKPLLFDFVIRQYYFVIVYATAMNLADVQQMPRIQKYRHCAKKLAHSRALRLRCRTTDVVNTTNDDLSVNGHTLLITAVA